jgi:predicted XRE-type DNA-binding protein
MKRKTTSAMELSKMFGISPARAMEAVFKAQMTSAILDVIKKEKITHAQIAARTGIPRSAVTGILSGSMQRVTLDRVLRMVEAVGLIPELKLRKAS